jgi:signal transduction histidine kinase
VKAPGVRRRMTVLVAATTSAVVLAFLVPLALLLRQLAEDRAITAATQDAQTLVSSAISIKDRATLIDYASDFLADGRTTLVLPDGTVLGVKVADPDLAQAGTARSFTVPRGDDVVVYVGVLGKDGVAVARRVVPADRLHEGVTRATAILGGLGVVVMLLAVLAADRLARRISAPIRQVAAAADALREGRLETRVPEAGPREVVVMAGALNRLAARIEQLLTAERDTVADLSHRLRTPVTALRLDADSVADPDVADRLRSHVAQLERTVDAIVHDARRPSRSGVAASCDVGRVVGDRVSYWSALAEDQGRPIRLALPDRALRARLDASDLADVVDVLIDNVFAHTDEGVPLEVWVVPRADGAVVLTVEDGGHGLPAGDVVTRGRSGAGSTGLGLDIVRRAALASGGGLELGRSRLGGALVRVALGRADR